ncbi:SAM-dependent methyltransferase [Microbispora corallina]|uniref:S-adenosyl methyltransferase n=1 Tax=Microbispora corallina TaxID=83302 RepID=A0ABQ4G1I9_9ACTN|nr:SAM-dependent methyltransferase [Microbispora corallina]GIH40895.1 hypothetical protein Mco01_38950 [Microbispora corallina]
METRATAAGIYNYLLGGDAWSAADRAAADRVLAVSAESRVVARRNRDFLVNAVRYVAGQGVRQFLDLGSGLPDGTNVHQIAQAVQPGARTVYVDNDAQVLPHARRLIEGDPDTAYVHADLREPAAVLGHPDTRRLLDLSRPVALLIVSVLHHVPDEDDPYGAVAALVGALALGSHLVVSHSSLDLDALDPEVRERVVASNATMRVPVTFRGADEVGRFFSGTRLVEPGLVYVEQWAPGRALPREPIPLDMLAGVGVKL